jgi:hypothetical protein
VTGHEVIGKDHDQSAARDYGKGKVGAQFPSTENLIEQINKDEGKKLSTVDRAPFDQEREVAKNLKPEDLKNIGTIVDAIQNGKFGPAHTGNGPHDSLGDALKAYEHNPQRLSELKDMIQVEMERRKLSNGQSLADKYDIDIQNFDDRKGANPATPEEMNRRALVVSSKGNDHKIHAYSTTGKVVPESLLKEFYD